MLLYQWQQHVASVEHAGFGPVKHDNGLGSERWFLKIRNDDDEKNTYYLFIIQPHCALNVALIIIYCCLINIIIIILFFFYPRLPIRIKPGLYFFSFIILLTRRHKIKYKYFYSLYPVFSLLQLYLIIIILYTRIVVHDYNAYFNNNYTTIVKKK